MNRQMRNKPVSDSLTLRSEVINTALIMSWAKDIAPTLQVSL